MPTYVYACKQCDDRTEVVQKMSDAPLTECAKCGGTLRKVLFPPAVVYKGSGFYITDYKNGGKSDSAASVPTPSESSSSSDTKTETKSETKTEAKADTKAASST